MAWAHLAACGRNKFSDDPHCVIPRPQGDGDSRGHHKVFDFEGVQRLLCDKVVFFVQAEVGVDGHLVLGSILGMGLHVVHDLVWVMHDEVNQVPER